jgi:colanic acid/amylovoran biosynthesis glycosyltransferase
MSTQKTNSSDLTPPGPIAYLIPEFPGQTHIWIWREVVHMRDWGVSIRLFSTRPPDPGSAARHSFAEEARKETTYLWPRRVMSMLRAVGWGLARPRRFGRAAAIPFKLDSLSLRQRASTLPLLVAACLFARDAASHGIRHVHLHSAARSTVIAMMARRLAGIPFSLALNAPLGWWGGGMSSKLRDAEFTVVNATWLHDEIRNSYPHLPPSQVLIARPGVDVRTWAPDCGAAGDSSFQLVTVGRVHHGKGHDIAIRSVARLRDAGRDVTLRIVGGGPAVASLQSLVRQLDLDRAVKFSGSVSEEDVIAFLRSAHAFVLATRFDALGVAYMEAMALGLPTIGTDVGGVGEVITDSHDGLLVPSEDDERLAAAIARLMDDSELRRRLSRNARRTAVERFDSRIGAATLFERLFGAPPPSATPTALHDRQTTREQGSDRAGRH